MIRFPASGPERAVAGVLVVGSVLFVGFGVPRLATAGFTASLTLPLVLLAADLMIATALVTGWYPIRPVAQGLAVFGLLVHALVTLRSGPLWTRGCSGVLLVAHTTAVVQLFLRTAAEDAEEEDEDEDEHAVPRARSEMLVETRVTDLVELIPPPLDRLPDYRTDPEERAR